MSTCSQYICFCLLLSLAACGIAPDRRQLAGDIALGGGLRAETVDTGIFRLQTFHRGLENSPEKLAVYIEGDGFAWKRRGVLSPDPTPKNPVALRLATRDPRAAVLYIARPCQYQPPGDLENCPVKYWSSHRYAGEVVESVNTAIDRNVKLSGAGAIDIIGYSGGGSIAAMIAARRTDVDSLVTVAGNLDHAAWTKHHDVSPLSGSFNAADIAKGIQHIPQYHFTGEKDDIVPAKVTQSYLDRMTDISHVKVERISGFDHECCWADAWPGLLCEAGAIDPDYCR